MKSTIFFALFSALVIISCSKSSKIQAAQEETEHAEALQRQTEAYEDSIFRAQRDELLKNGTQEELQSHLDTQEDLYLRYEHKFESMMINGVIPDHFPKHNREMDTETYMGNVKNWLRENPTLLKPEFR